jgi:hypothetical protein
VHLLPTKQEHKELANGTNVYLKLKPYRRYKCRTIRTRISPVRDSQVTRASRAGNRNRVKADRPIRVANRAVANRAVVSKVVVSKVAVPAVANKVVAKVVNKVAKVVNKVVNKVVRSRVVSKVANKEVVASDKTATSPAAADRVGKEARAAIALANEAWLRLRSCFLRGSQVVIPERHRSAMDGGRLKPSRSKRISKQIGSIDQSRNLASTTRLNSSSSIGLIASFENMFSHPVKQLCFVGVFVAGQYAQFLHD